MCYLSLLTDTQLNRIGMRLYRRITKDCYGWDWKTLWATNPALFNSFDMVMKEMRTRHINLSS